MFTPGSILYGLFDLKIERKNKYAIILHNNGFGFIVATFTTSQKRAGINPLHGKNPVDNPNCYVFKAGVVIGETPKGEDFSFRKDTVVVPDYGYSYETDSDFRSKVSNLHKVCKLHKQEFIELLHTLCKCKSLPREYRKLFEAELKIQTQNQH
jgi:hypothetical protein